MGDSCARQITERQVVNRIKTRPLQLVSLGCLRVIAVPSLLGKIGCVLGPWLAGYTLTTGDSQH